MNSYLLKIKVAFSVTFLLIGGFLYFGKALAFNALNTTKQAANENNSEKSYASIEITGEELAEIDNSDEKSVLGVSTQIATSVPVLLYHGVLEKTDGENIDIQTFKDQMMALKKAGYKTISIQHFHDFVKGIKELPAKSFLLTFDDGRKDSYYPVDPILEALDYRAVMYVITDRSINKNSNFHLNEQELIKMEETDRWDLESHGKFDHDLYKTAPSADRTAHFLSNLLWLEDKQRIETEDEFLKRITEDLSISKVELESLLQKNVISFAYPFGDFGQSSENYSESEQIVPRVTKSFYPISFFQEWNGRLKRNYVNSNNSLFVRINVEPEWSGTMLLNLLENTEDKTLPFEDSFDSNMGWSTAWGGLSIHKGLFSLFSNDNSTSAAAYLEGSYLWKNIEAKAHVDFFDGETVSMIARDNEKGSYATCTFSPTNVSFRVYQRDMEVKKVITLRDTVVEGKNLGMQVDDTEVRCLINDIPVLDIDHKNTIPSSGRVGFSIWTTKEGMSKLVLDNVQVRKIKD